MTTKARNKSKVSAPVAPISNGAVSESGCVRMKFLSRDYLDHADVLNHPVFLQTGCMGPCKHATYVNQGGMCITAFNYDMGFTSHKKRRMKFYPQRNAPPPSISFQPSSHLPISNISKPRLSDLGLSVGTPMRESRLEQFEFMMFLNALLHLSLSNFAIYGRAMDALNLESAWLSLAVLSWNALLLLTLGTGDRLGVRGAQHFPPLTVALMTSVCLYCASQSFRTAPASWSRFLLIALTGVVLALRLEDWWSLRGRALQRFQMKGRKRSLALLPGGVSLINALKESKGPKGPLALRRAYQETLPQALGSVWSHLERL